MLEKVVRQIFKLFIVQKNNELNIMTYLTRYFISSTYFKFSTTSEASKFLATNKNVNSIGSVIPVKH